MARVAIINFSEKVYNLAVDKISKYHELGTGYPALPSVRLAHKVDCTPYVAITEQQDFLIVVKGRSFDLPLTLS